MMKVYNYFSSHGFSILLLLFLYLFTRRTNCHWSLTMNEAESTKHLGVLGELHYVKNGVVNDYALAFKVPVHSDTDEIRFDWENSRTDPSIPDMRYSIAVQLSNSHALQRPYLRIPSRGIMPNKRTSLIVYLKCTGDTVADVDVKLQFEFSPVAPAPGHSFSSHASDGASNVTKLVINRLKHCLKNVDKQTPKISKFKTSEREEIYRPGGDDDDDVGGDDDDDDGVLEQIPEDKITFPIIYLYVLAGCGIGAVAVIGFIVLCCLCRKPKNRTGLGANGGPCPQRRSLPTKPLEHQNYCTYPPPPSDSLISGSSSTQHNTPFSSYKPNYQEALYLLNEISFNRHLISLGEIVAQGLHGSIYRGLYTIKSPDGDATIQQPIIIKAFLEESNFDPVSSAMLSEACLLRGLSHANLSPCVGSCLDRFPMMVLYEDAGSDNLKIFLTRIRTVEVLSPQQLTYIALQVARGLAFLHSQKILHKDVAARNCYVTSNLQARLGDNFLSSDIFRDDYISYEDGEYLPVRWMAIESLADRCYTPATDVWSLGVLIWELFSLAEQPYSGVETCDVSCHLMRGFRLQQPRLCPTELFAVTSRCWLMSPGERPRMNHYLTFLVNFYNTLSRFV